MSYTKTQWTNDTAPAINETNLNKIEQGIYDNDSHIGDLSDLETTANTDLVSAINENTSDIDNLEDMTNGTKEMGSIVVNGIKTKNIVDYRTSENGAIPSNSTSNMLDINTYSLTTAWTPCKPNTTYVMSGTGINRGRWQTKSADGTITFAADSTTCTTNATAKYLRVYYYYDSSAAATPNTIPDLQIEEGSTATAYTPYQSLDNTGKYRGTFYADNFKGKNLFMYRTGETSSVNGAVITKYINKINIKNTPSSTAYSGISVPLRLERGVTYTLSSNINLPHGADIYMNDYGNLGLSYAQTNIPEGARKVTFTPSQTGVINFAIYLTTGFDGTATDLYLQLEENSEPTEWTEHKFDGEERYTQFEQRIGTWIDGKPLYRKVASFTISSGWDSVGSFSNIDKFIKITGVRAGAGNGYPFYGSSSSYCYFYIPTSKSSIFIASSGETSAQGYLVVEYTKTTD